MAKYVYKNSNIAVLMYKTFREFPKKSYKWPSFLHCLSKFYLHVGHFPSFPIKVQAVKNTAESVVMFFFEAGRKRDHL